MASDESEVAASPEPMTDVIQQIVEAALTSTKKPVLLSQRLFAMGIRNDQGGPISESSIYAWKRGAQGIRATTLLALAVVADVKIDPILFKGPDPRDERLRRLEERMERLEGGGDVK